MLPLLLAIARPNSLDREVDAISRAALLTQSPFALIDPARAAAAQHLEQFRVPLWIVMIALQIGVLAWFWSSGWSALLRDRLRSRLRSEFAMRFVFGATLALIDRIAAFVPQLLAYRLDRIMDLTSALTRTWGVQWIGSTVVEMIVAGAIAAIVLWLVDRTHQWYLYTIAGVIGFTLLVSYVNPLIFAPLFSRFEPFNAPPAVRAEIAQLRRETGVGVPLLTQRTGRGSALGSAYVIGWGGTQRGVIADTIAAGATPPEVAFVAARLFAYVELNLALHLALVQGAFLVIGVAIAVFAADRVGFRRDDDPASRLALLGALMGCVYLIALPFYNGYVRNVEIAAEDRAVVLTGARADAIRLIVRGADQALVPICPSAFTYWYFGTRPPAGERIAELQDRPNPCVTAAR